VLVYFAPINIYSTVCYEPQNLIRHAYSTLLPTTEAVRRSLSRLLT